MTGIVNSTGAKSGIIGTTVGTPVTDLATATFPAGHVLQTRTNRSTVSVTGTGECLAVSHTITPSSSSSKILAVAHIFATFYTDYPSGNHIMQGGFNMKSSSSGTDEIMRFGRWNVTGYYGVQLYFDSQNWHKQQVSTWSVSFEFSPAIADSVVTISANGHGYDADTGTCATNQNHGSTPYPSSSITLMEIQG